ncbi:MAG: methyltransferase domain-containing protein [Fluviicola sp.]|nr:methyltransferase domain-containing protein [Fluviicola sp.]
MEHLSEEFWSKRYADESTGWDLGEISRPIKAYFDQVENKELKILIPGCGNGHEAEYLHRQGFANVHVLDFAKAPLDALILRVPTFPKENTHCEDFFKHEGEYDIIVEQTLFCALNPSLRMDYAENAKRLLKPSGKLIGLFFEFELDGGPPFGGDRKEYQKYFEKHFDFVQFEDCYNSIEPRKGRELFGIFK